LPEIPAKILDFFNSVRKFTRVILLMCGRFALNMGLGQLRARLNVRRVSTNGRTFVPSNNIAPQDTAPVVSGDSIELLTWGIAGATTTIFNARSETAASTFRRDIAERRCVVPADGFFEWTKQRQPHFFKHGSGEMMFFAAFFTGRGEFVILTRDANDSVAPIHDRMPIIVMHAQLPHWEGPHWAAMLADKPPSLMSYPVARTALRSGFTGEECVRPLVEKKESTLDRFLKAEKNAAIRSFR
jgi:putative SOS response-associated peptidase YedK